MCVTGPRCTSFWNWWTSRDLVERGRMLPSVVQDEQGGFARWRPVLQVGVAGAASRVMSPCMAKKDSRHSPSGIAALSRSSAASAPVRHTPLSRDGTSRPGGRNHSDLLRCRRWIEMGVRIRRGQSRGGAQAPSGQRRCVCRAGLHGRVPLPRSVDPLRAIGVGDPWPPLQLPIGRN